MGITARRLLKNVLTLPEPERLTMRACLIGALVLSIACGSSEETAPAPGPSSGGSSAGGAGGGAASAGAGGSGGGGQGAGGQVPAQLCPPGSKDGPVDGATGEQTSGGLTFNVRTPASYDPTVGHPLLLVFPFANGSATSIENSTGLTPDATGRGYVVAYSSYVSPVAEWEDLEDAATIPAEVSSHWCIDPERVFVTGHSAGGSMAWVMAIYELPDPLPAAIAPSAAGVDTSVTAQLSCPSVPFGVIVFHSADDTLFPPPEFGADTTPWWADCNGCSEPAAVGESGCLEYDGCPAAGPVQYCEGTGPHGAWPDKNSIMLDFFEQVAE